jgi:uncharacterized membrane protein
MPEPIAHGLVVLTRLLEICGAAFLILGFIIDTIRWFQHMRQHGHVAARHRYRGSLGRSVLIGLEMLVAATIIKTIIVEPSVEGMGLLAGTIVIRTVLGWTTVLEVNGRWPWQRDLAGLPRLPR